MTVNGALDLPKAFAKYVGVAALTVISSCSTSAFSI
jgi:hypothetical protein